MSNATFEIIASIDNFDDRARALVRVDGRYFIVDSEYLADAAADEPRDDLPE